jgi:hypothetical protein
MTVSTLLLVAALACFVLAAVPVNTGRVAVGWAGAALFTAAVLLDGVALQT